MSFALESAQIFIQNKLRALALTHLCVHIYDRNLMIFSVSKQEKAYRASLSFFSGGIYVLSVANHRGNWQLIPLVGTLPEIMAVLTNELVFTLSRWQDEE